jgi:hypothetical protein
VAASWPADAPAASSSAISFKLYSLADQGNVLGSNAMTVMRPVVWAGIFGRRAFDVRPPARLKVDSNEFKKLLASWCATACSTVVAKEVVAADELTKWNAV